MKAPQEASNADRIRSLVRATPNGKVCLYTDISEIVYGHSGAAQGITAALNKGASDDPSFPWWRLVNAGGGMPHQTQSDMENQAERLRREGVEVADLHVVNLEKFRHHFREPDLRTQEAAWRTFAAAALPALICQSPNDGGAAPAAVEQAAQLADSMLERWTARWKYLI